MDNVIKVNCKALEGKRVVDTTVDVVLPVVHMNGTGRDALLEDRMKIAERLRAAREAMVEGGPNGRDYYPVPGLMDQALAQHRRRLTTINQLIAEFEGEMEAIAD